MKCICVTGPESCGKSDLSKALAESLNGQWVPEYARIYLEARGSDYDQSDLLRIAEGQMKAEELAWSQTRRPIVLDTSLEVLKIWTEEVFHGCHARIDSNWASRNIDHYLLCYPDLPWTPDPLRENPDDRMRLFEIYHALLQQHQLPFSVVKGQGADRLASALNGLGGTIG